MHGPRFVPRRRGLRRLPRRGQPLRCVTRSLVLSQRPLDPCDGGIGVDECPAGEQLSGVTQSADAAAVQRDSLETPPPDLFVPQPVGPHQLESAALVDGHRPARKPLSRRVAPAAAGSAPSARPRASTLMVCSVLAAFPASVSASGHHLRQRDPHLRDHRLGQARRPRPAILVTGLTARSPVHGNSRPPPTGPSA